MRVLPLFPTPIASFSDFITEKERLKLLKEISAREHQPHSALNGDGVSTHFSVNTTNGAPAWILSKDLKKRLQEAVYEYSDMFGCTRTQIDNVWTNIQNKGSILNEHRHAGAMIAGALYLNVDQTCKLSFQNPNPYIHSTPYSKNLHTSFYMSHFYWIPVKNCLLVLFPAWLEHGGNKEVNTMDNRVVLSFNAGPRW